ncbi:hypothetical protein BX616_004181, partial [Lobosporangium transversale]
GGQLRHLVGSKRDVAEDNFVDIGTPHIRIAKVPIDMAYKSDVANKKAFEYLVARLRLISSKELGSAIKRHKQLKQVEPKAAIASTKHDSLQQRAGQFLSWVRAGKDYNSGSDLWSWITSYREYAEEDCIRLQACETKYNYEVDLSSSNSNSGNDTTTFIKPAPTAHKCTNVIDTNVGTGTGMEAEANIEATKIDNEKRVAHSAWNKILMNQSLGLAEWDKLALMVITLVAVIVRIWRISWPDEVTLDEANIGKMINRYITGEYAFDAHPPLGTMIMAGIAAMTRYNGTFAFDEIGDLIPGSVPYMSVRLSMAILGALCAPMAFITLKTSDQDTPAALLAASMITFVATGISMASAAAVKLIGIVAVVTVSLFTLSALYSLAIEPSVNTLMWLKHATARVVGLIMIPILVYTSIFHIHFQYQSYLPSDPSSALATHDLNLLSRSFHRSLISKPKADKEKERTETPIWSDIAFGSVVQLQNEDTDGMFIHSFHNMTPGKPDQQQVGGYEYPDLNTHWIVIRAISGNADGNKDNENDDEKDEIPTRLQYLKHGDTLRLRHVPTRRCLHSHKVASYSSKEGQPLFEVTAFGTHDRDGDYNDWWTIEAVDPVARKKVLEETDQQIKALRTAFRLRHTNLGCYLYATTINLPKPWGRGRKELVCRPDVGVRPRAIWRFTTNLHDYLPYETPLASFPQLSFWQKFIEIHSLMWAHYPLAESAFRSAQAHPIRWPLGQAMIHVWAGYRRQITVLANPVVWGISTMGMITYLGLGVWFILRKKRGYTETGFMAGWIMTYLPFFFIDRTLLMHHYFPALYFSVLITSSLITRVSGFISKKARVGLWAGLIALLIIWFVRLSPLSYASPLTREQ